MVSKLLREMGIEPEVCVVKRRKRYLNEAEIAEVRDLKRMGYPQKYISQKFDVSQSTISRILRGSRHSNESKRQKHLLDDESVRLIRFLYARKSPENKVTLKSLGERFDRSLSTIWGIVHDRLYKHVQGGDNE